MSIPSIKALIAVERSVCNIVGTPRTYGDRKTEDVWRTCVGNDRWKGVPANPVAVDQLGWLGGSREGTRWRMSVTRLWKGGDVDYRPVRELEDADLEQYRGPSREETRITAACSTNAGAECQLGFISMVRPR
jgi:hypothetical protein